MTKQIPWELLVLEAVQMGGVVVFLEDTETLGGNQLLKELQSQFSGEVPFVRRQIQDLLSGKFETKAQDLVFFQATQHEMVWPLNSILQGQRVLLWDHGDYHGKAPFDFVWTSFSQKVWQQMLGQLKNRWPQATKIEDLALAHQTPCLFLDRDDVVVKNVPYNKEPEKVELMPGIIELISRAHRQGYWVALVTNQSGLGRGLINWREYQQVHQRTLQLLAEAGCWLDECVWSGYIDQDGVWQGRLLAGQRKPRTGMFQLVNQKLKVDMARSVMVGDSASDIIAAYGAGVAQRYLFCSEKWEKEIQKLEKLQDAENSKLQMSYHKIQNFSEIVL